MASLQWIREMVCRKTMTWHMHFSPFHKNVEKKEAYCFVIFSMQCKSHAYTLSGNRTNSDFCTISRHESVFWNMHSKLGNGNCSEEHCPNQYQIETIDVLIPRTDLRNAWIMTKGQGKKKFIRHMLRECILKSMTMKITHDITSNEHRSLVTWFSRSGMYIFCCRLLLWRLNTQDTQLHTWCNVQVSLRKDAGWNITTLCTFCYQIYAQIFNLNM